MGQYRMIFSVLVVLLLVIFTYTLLHEGGHALAVLVQGGEVTNIDLNFILSSPHITYVGEFSLIQRAIVSIAGPLFPFFVWVLMLPLLPGIKNSLLQGALLLYSITLIGTFVPLIVFPLLYWQGTVLPGEDVIRFIQYTGLHPFLVTGGFFILLIFSIWYGVRVGRMIPLVRQLLFEQAKSAAGIPVYQRVLGVLVVVFLSVWVLLQMTAPRTPMTFVDDYEVVKEIHFSDLTSTQHRVYSFQVLTPTSYNIAFTLSTQGPIELQLINTSGDHFLYRNTDTLMLYQGKSSLTNVRFSDFLLEPGCYEIQLLTEDRGGRLKLGICSREPDPTQLSYRSLLFALQEGNFSVDTYQEEGYDLLYQAPLTDTEDELIYTIQKSSKINQLSIFVVGEFESIQVLYRADGSTIPILTDRNATIGFGIPLASGEGELLLWASKAAGEIFVYGSGDDLKR